MQRKDLALRVLSTAAIMSIVTSIAAPAFADIYYIGNGSIDVETITSTDGKQQYVKVTQGNKTYTDTSDEIVIKDGTSEKNTTQIEESRIDGKKANVAVPDNERTDTQEPEAAGSADAAGESQPDPDAGFTLNETGEDSAQTQEGKDTTKKDEDTTEPSTDNPTENPKKDVVYEYAPADPEPEKPTTKLTPTTSAAPAAKTSEATLADAPAPTTPAAGSVTTPTTSVIKVINNWVGEAAKEFKIRLSNVNIKPSYGQAAMDVSGGGTTKVELDGQNVLDSSESCRAGLRKQGEGTLIITDETDDNGNKITAPKSESDTSGSLTAKGGGSNGSAGIGGNIGESTKNITIEGYATVDATGGGSGGAGIGGGGGQSGDAENIIIQGHSKVTASADDGAAIGAAGYSGDFTEAEVTIGTPGATAATEDVHIIATGLAGSAIGNGGSNTNVTIQGHVTIQTASSNNSIAIGSNYGNVKVNIKDNASIDTATGAGASGIGGGYLNRSPGREVEVNIDGGTNGKVKLGENSAIIGSEGAISATKVKIGNNVLLKMQQSGGANNEYIKVKNNAGNEVEAEVGKRSDPTAGGLVNTIGDNTELWYTNYYNKLQKIVHGKNLCKKELVDETPATCTTPGSKTYKCTFESFESNNSAVDPEHTEQWTETIDKLGHDFTVKQSETPATCETAGTIVWKCSRCDETKTETIPALNHDYRDDWTVTTPATCTTEGVETRYCHNDHNHFETRPTALNGSNHGSHGTHIEGYVAPHLHQRRLYRRHLLQRLQSENQRRHGHPRHRPPLEGQRRRHPHLPRLRCHRGPACQHQQRP